MEQINLDQLTEDVLFPFPAIRNLSATLAGSSHTQHRWDAPGSCV